MSAGRGHFIEGSEWECEAMHKMVVTQPSTRCRAEKAQTFTGSCKPVVGLVQASEADEWLPIYRMRDGAGEMDGYGS